jgi:hypothetical protein
MVTGLTTGGGVCVVVSALVVSLLSLLQAVTNAALSKITKQKRNLFIVFKEKWAKYFTKKI